MLGFSQLVRRLGAMEDTIGRRVLASITKLNPERTHAEIAASIQMTRDAFSRSVNDLRAFTSLELALLADELDADLHWLITGEVDPNRVVFAARHCFDPVTMERSIPSVADDRQALDDICLAYVQAYLGEPAPMPELPTSPSDIRVLLGEGFVRPFIERLETRLDVDAVRISEISTAYSFMLCGRRVIAVPSEGNWFHENWSLAHELGHLVLGHHQSSVEPCVSDVHEAAANRFAAELLMPEDLMRSIDWQRASHEDLATRVWDLGVSTKALCTRLNGLGINSDVVESWALHATQRLLRRHCHHIRGDVDEITRRMDQAAQRHFAVSLQERHIKKIATGELGKQTLAWMMDVHADKLEVDAPTDDTELTGKALASALGL